MRRRVAPILFVAAAVLFVAAFVQFYISVWTGSNPIGGSGFLTLILAVVVVIVGGVVWEEDN